MDRLSSDQYFGEICLATAQRSTCPKASVGAVLVSPRNTVISTGYNGSPRSFPHCTEVGCILDQQGKCIRTVHAEINALIQAPYTANCSLYCTHTPCLDCIKAIINTGIVRVGYMYEYIDPRLILFEGNTENYQLNMLAFAGIDTFKI